MWRTFHVKNEKLLDVSAIHCLDWYEVDISIHCFSKGIQRDDLILNIGLRFLS